jgi:hypothetical protein
MRRHDRTPYDLGRVNQRIGSGERMSLIFVVTTKAAGDSGSLTDTFDFSVVSATAADLTTGQKVLETRRIPGADLVVGKLVEVPIPVGVPLQRYLGGKVAVGTGDTVSCECFIVPSTHVQDYFAYAKGYSV